MSQRQAPEEPVVNLGDAGEDVNDTSCAKICSSLSGTADRKKA